MRPLEETEAAWVTDYFGDDYLRLYQFPEERTGPEVAWLTRELAARIATDGWVLDLGCGQGRHAVRLAERGWRLVGLDYQHALLRAAAEAARARSAALTLLRGDMRRIPCDVAFDAVLSLFSAFGYFSDADNAVVLGEVARVLRPGGVFILDVANRDALLRAAQPRGWKRLPDGTPVISEWTWDVPTGRYTHWQAMVGAAGTLREFTHTVRVYTYTELDAMLRRVGLVIEAAHGGFTGEPVSLEAPRLVLIARKVPMGPDTERRDDAPVTTIS